MAYILNNPILPPFTPESDANALYEAMKGFGTNEAVLIDYITGRTREQLQHVKVAYTQKHRKSLEEVVKKETSGNLENVLIALLKDGAEFDAWQIHKAVDGLGTTESVLIEVLTTRSNSEIAAIKARYLADYGSEMDHDVKGDVSGDFKKALKALMKGSRSEDPHITEAAAKAVAISLHDAGEDRLGTDESTFINVLTSHSWAQIQQIASAYHKISTKTLEEAIASETSGDFRELLLAIVNPARYVSDLVFKAVKGAGTNDRALIRVLSRCDKGRLAAAKIHFKNQHGMSMDKAIEKDTSGDFRKALRRLLCCYVEDFLAVALREAMKGAGTDEKAIIRVITSLPSKKSVVNVAAAYEHNYDKPLSEAFKEELSGNFESFCIALTLPKEVLDARSLRKAMSGVGTNEGILIEILTSRKGQEIAAIRDAYHREFNRDLISDIEKETSSNLKRGLVALARGNRRTGVAPLSSGEASSLAERLYNAGENRKGTDEDTFTDIFTTYSFQELESVDNAYKEKYKKSLEKAVKKETSGDYEEFLLACMDPYENMARHLRRAMKGMGTNDDELVRIIASREKNEIAELKEAFHARTKKKLAECIESECSGNYKKIVLAYIG
eukprot:TRINITY_DN701_c0_g1_i1.p1 TRINITY_DN701_c0_g1~~TRINITY_DN701_c0_g1_i1.p1  ORF type:complete len:614 (+),score=165.80 TRINITY_DN701_c0_g1_i1:92-1933(+)